MVEFSSVLEIVLKEPWARSLTEKPPQRHILDAQGILPHLKRRAPE
ncbi:hypothetical protein CCHR01_05274 [Colletotrichum chrysophilum]|uniref:Uncharacterized protein n=1 Tax=Colletotrichum chrysophilum TaxID=1836956 RepID=A0AAD9ELR6_9PEZI|nr:hypothetical protein CCHR01_05274 [Colletotrichum chrysophilum]